jgi:adenylate cyclase
MTEARAERRLAAILVADVAGYSRLMGADEEGTLAALTAHLTELVEPCIAEHRGRVVKTTGDGLLAEFASVVDCVRCAVAIQDGMREGNLEVPEERRIEFRIGVNLGDVIVQDDDLFGDGVNVAARLEGLAEPGGICVSDMALQGIRSNLDLPFDDLGSQHVKNIVEPVHVYRVRLGQAGPAPAAAPPKPPPVPERPSIAILPFDSYSKDPEQEAFADGMTEDLTTDLSKISGLFVVARNSAQAFKGERSDLRQVAESLGVRYLLEGSVRRSGQRIRINAQLIEGSTGGHLWADRYDGTVDDVFELQDAVGAEVVAVLSVKLTEGEKESLQRVHTDNLQAYELFVRAKAAPYPPIPERINAAREMFEEVIEMAPDFAGGYAGVATMIGMGSLWSHGDVSSAVARAEELARHAIAVDETFAWSHAALGLALLQQKKYDEALLAARETIRLQPSDADGHVYLGMVTAIAGAPLDGVRCGEEAIRLNPRFFAGPYWNLLGLSQLLAGNYEAAIEALETNIRQQGPLGPPAVCFRLAAYQALGNADKAAEIVEELRARFPGFRIEGWNFASLIRPDEAQRRYLELLRAAGVP